MELRVVLNWKMNLWLASTVNISIETELINDKPREYSEETMRMAAIHWDQAKTRISELFDGDVWSLINWRLEDDESLILSIELTSYKYVLYTLFSGAVVPEIDRVNPLGSSAVTVTKDGKVVLGLRNGRCGTSPDVWHLVPAGNVDSPDVVAHIRSELSEELNIYEFDDFSVKVMGLFDTGAEQGHKTEIVFLIKLNSLTFDDVYKRFGTVRAEHDEHVDLIGVTEVPRDIPMTTLAKSALGSYFSS